MTPRTYFRLFKKRAGQLANGKSLKRLVELFGFQSNWYLVFLAAIIGIITSCGAIGFMWLLHQAERLFLHWPPYSGGSGGGGEELVALLPWWLLILAPAVGAAVCGVIVHYGAPEAKGHGVPEVMVALYRNKGEIRPRVALFKSIASAFTIGSGGSAGAEGPIVQIGSAIGSYLAKILRVSPEHTGTLLGCGAAAGIATVFNAPIAGIFFVLEILLRDFSLRTFTPIVIASVFSVATTQAITDNHEAIFLISGTLVEYQFVMTELPYYLLLGLICGAVAVTFTRILDYTETFYDNLKIHNVLKPISGALLLGLVTVPIMWFVQSKLNYSEAMPPYYGNGYSFITSCLTNEFYQESTQIWLLLAGLGTLVILKMAATCLTLGSGGSGGIFAPSLFLGAAIGGAFGILVTQVNPFGTETLNPAAYALVGMGAVAAGTTHAPLTAMLILFEITGDYKIILPIMLTAVIATILAQILLTDSIYTIKVRRKGIRVGRMSDLTVLRRISVEHVPLARAFKVHPQDPAQMILTLSQRHDAVDFVVVDDDDKYVGMVTAEEIRTTLLQVEALPLLVVGELMRTDLPTTSPDETLDVVMDKFSRTDASSLVVLETSCSPFSEPKEKVAGRITRSGMMRQYHLALDKQN